MILAFCAPNNYFMPLETVKSFLSLAGKYEITCSQGPYIYDNRNQLLKFAKKCGDSLLQIDSDIVFTPEDVNKMETHLESLRAITGVYPLGVPPYPAALFKRVENDYEYIEPPKELSIIGACGGGFFGLSSELVQALPDNAFDNIFESSMHGEDISVCHRINNLGYQIWCDPEIKVGQVRSKVIYFQ